MYAVAPAPLAFWSSPESANEVMAMIGVAAIEGSARRRRIASMPEIFGSWMSMRMRSGRASSAFATPIADRDMPEKLRAEADAVLAWMVRGFLGWQQAGLQPPAAVLSATQDYLDAQDTLGLWLAERCDTTDPTAETNSSTLYASFKAWKDARGERAPSTVRFSGLLEQRFRKERRGGMVRFLGIRLHEGLHEQEGQEGLY
jgi:putative DNA primase/helicase